VVDLLHRADESERLGDDVTGVFVISQTAAALEFEQTAFDDLGQELLQFLHIVVPESLLVGVLEDTSVEVGPGQILITVVEVSQTARLNLCIEVDGQLLEQRTLHREAFVQETFDEGLFVERGLDDCFGALLELRPASPAHHLQDVGHGHVHLAFVLGVLVLGALDDHHLSGQIDAPGQSRGCNQHLDLAGHKQFLANLAVFLLQACVVDADPRIQEFFHVLVLAFHHLLFDFCVVAFKESFAAARQLVAVGLFFQTNFD